MTAHEPSSRPSRRRHRLRTTAAAALLAVPALAFAASPPAYAAAAHATGAAHTAVHTQEARPSAPAEEGPENSHYCDGCTVPLSYHGGPVVDTSSDDGLTITPIFWAPHGESFPAHYEDLIDQFITDVAADSGKNTNVFSIASEYPGGHGSTKLAYKVTAGEALDDDNDYDNGAGSPCDLKGSYDSCVTDKELVAEVQFNVDSQRLPADTAHFYPVFFPPNVQTQDRDNSRSLDDYCGYHRDAKTGHGTYLYANEPFLPDGCGPNESPNNNLQADQAIDTLTHEVMEAMTDPIDNTAWTDTVGYEIGDICELFHGVPLGSTSSAHPDKTEYNQVINGDKYYVQTEFSNRAYARFGKGNGCQESEKNVNRAPSAGATLTATSTALFSYATPSALPDPDTGLTSRVQVQVTDADGNGVSGDRVAWGSYAVDGPGSCGSLSSTSTTSDSNGFTTITYRGNKTNVICAVVAQDAQGGASSTAVVYQGTYRGLALRTKNTFPKTLHLGQQSTFTLSFTNPTGEAVRQAELDLAIFPGDHATTNVDAKQITLTYSTTGAHGHFQSAGLSGSTISDGEIVATLGDPTKGSIAAHSTKTFTFHMTLASSITNPAAHGPLFGIEGYVDQINPATGSGTNLADTLEHDVSVS